MSHLQKIPLNLLKPSPKNVRKHQGSVAQLAASIAADGLIQSLAVEKVNGHFEVVAGGRRLRALQQLAKEGKLADDEPVNCNVVDSERAAGISLAENVIREAMRPTEQFNAFRAALDEDGATEAGVAARFGVTTKFLQQRMKLARLCTSVLEALETGEISLEVAEAFTLTDDQERQEAVWADFEPAYDDAEDVRARLLHGHVYPSDSRVKFVGLAAYEKAGGVVVRDLFAENDKGYLADEELLDKLVLEKLEKSAKSVRAEGWAFVDVGPAISVYTYERLYGDAAAKADKSLYGAVVTLAHPGKVEITRGVRKPGQMVAKDKATGERKLEDAPAPKKDASQLSAAAVVRLQGHRTAVLRHQVGQNPRVALAALAATLASRELLQDYGAEGVDAMVRIGRGSSMGVSFASTADAPTIQEYEDAEAMWTDRLPSTENGVFAWLLENPEQLTIDLLAFLAGRAIAENQIDPEPGARFAQLAGVDIAQHWKVTPEWLQQQPTGYLVAAVTEACGKKAGEEVARAKGKAGAVAKAHELLAKVDGWLPAPLRTPAPTKATKKGAKK